MSCRHSILDGMSLTTLQSQLQTMQQAYLDLSSGVKGENFSYTQGDGSKAVTFTRANISDLVQAIVTVQTQIDRLTCVRSNRRGPLSVRFR